MKFTNIYTILFGIVLFLQSCTDINQFHEKYIDDGEIVYTTKPVVETYPGRNRVHVKVLYPAPNSATQTIVEWNDGENSEILDVNPQGRVDSAIVEINNLDEKSYFIDIFNMDPEGNRSIKVQTSGTAYGGNYESTLNNKLLLDLYITENDSIAMEWGAGGNGAVLLEMKYTDQNQSSNTVQLPASVETSYLDNWIPGSKVTYRTLYLPAPNAIDTFYSKLDTVELPIPVESILLENKDQWSIIEFDTEEPAEGNDTYPRNGLAEAAIDGNLETFWHTQWSGGSPGYPHYFVVDLGSEYKVTAVESFRRRGDDRGQTVIKVLTSNDGKNWTDNGTYDIDRASDDGQMSELEEPTPPARYLRYEAVSGPNFFAALAELNVYVVKE